MPVENLVFQLWTVYPTIAATQPPIGNHRARNRGTKFYYRQKKKNNKAKRGFHTTFFPSFLLFHNKMLSCHFYLFAL